MFPDKTNLTLGFLLVFLISLNPNSAAAQSKNHIKKEIYSQASFNNQLWFSSEDGVFIHDNSKNASHKLVVAIKDDVVTSMSRFKSQMVMGTFNGSIWVVNENGQGSKYKLPSVEGIKTYLIKDIIVSANEAWIATLEGVVFQFNPASGSFKPYTLKTYNGKYLLNIKSLSIDDDGHIWVNAQDRVYFLSTMFSRKPVEYEFIGSSNFNFIPGNIVKLKDKMWVLALENNKLNLYQGAVQTAFFDATKSALKFPNDFKPLDEFGVIMCSDGENRVVVIGSNMTFWNGEDWKTSELPKEIGSHKVNNIQIHDNLLWFGTTGGLFSTKL